MTDTRTGTRTGTARAHTLAPPQLVHKHNRDQVLIGDCWQVYANTDRDRDREECEYAMEVVWPDSSASGWLPTDADGHRDTLLVPETMRQGGIVVAHIGLGVERDARFLIYQFAWRVNANWMVAANTSPITMRVRASNVVRREGMVRRALYDLLLVRDDTPFAHGVGKAICLGTQEYRRLHRDGGEDGAREDANACKLAPGMVGKVDAADVVLSAPFRSWRSEMAGSWKVVSDVANPRLYDHGGDHISGMVQMEAYRQAAWMLKGPGRMVAWEGEFKAIAKPSDEVWCHATVVGNSAEGNSVVTGTLFSKTGVVTRSKLEYQRMGVPTQRRV